MKRRVVFGFLILAILWAYYLMSNDGMTALTILLKGAQS